MAPPQRWLLLPLLSLCWSLLPIATAADWSPFLALRPRHLVAFYPLDSDYQDYAPLGVAGYQQHGVARRLASGISQESGARLEPGSGLDLPLNIHRRAFPRLTLGAWVQADPATATRKADACRYSRRFVLVLKAEVVLDLSWLAAIDEIRLGACSVPEAGAAQDTLVGFNGRIDEVSLWSTGLDAQALLDCGSKLSGTEEGLLGYWTFDSAQQTLLAPTSAVTRSTVLDAEIRVLSFDPTRPMGPLFLGPSGTSVSDQIQVNNDAQAERIKLTAFAPPTCSSVRFSIVEPPDLGALFKASGDGAETQDSQIDDAETELNSPYVFFTAPASQSYVVLQTSFVFTAECDKNGGSTVSRSTARMTIYINPVQLQPFLSLGERIEHTVSVAQIVDPDENEYNTATSFSLAISGGESPSISLPTSAVIASATITTRQDNEAAGSGGPVIVEGSADSSEINAVLAGTSTEVNVQNPLDVNFHLSMDPSGSTGASPVNYDYGFQHTFVSLPFISDFSPKVISTDGSTIELQGSNFGAGCMCLIGGSTTVQATLISRTLLKCVIPKQTFEGSITLAVYAEALPYEKSNMINLAVVPAFTLWSLQPENRQVHLASEVNIQGAPNFDPQFAVCRVNRQIEILPLKVTADSISCQIPQIDPNGHDGAFELEISQNAVDFVSVGEFWLCPRPWIFRLSPARVFRSMTSQVLNIFGMNFLNLTSLSCSVGGIGSRAVFISASRVQCVVEPFQYDDLSSFIEVDVSVNGADFTEQPAHFSLVDIPSIRSLSPDNGPTAGGTMVGIAGEGFSDDSRYSIYNEEYVTGVVEYVNSSFLVWRTAGVDLVGSTMGREDEYACMFETKEPAFMVEMPATTVFSSCIQCLAPRQQSPGTATLTIIHVRSRSRLDTFRFEFYEPPEIERVSPDRVQAVGVTLSAIYVYGTNFRGDLAFSCVFDTILTATATVYNSTVASCSLPNIRLLPSETQVHVTNNLGDISGSFALFRIDHYEMEIDDISPTRKFFFVAGG
ncbi:hypothetical protein BBJ28_00004864 [Nothophytophthora sp. Chile5]|nr:hypothetical protein BBJ28_00004864 [Nothophytophthora sp. Chile5]